MLGFFLYQIEGLETSSKSKLWSTFGIKNTDLLAITWMILVRK
jgi:hypothetical protein